MDLLTDGRARRAGRTAVPATVAAALSVAVLSWPVVGCTSPDPADEPDGDPPASDPAVAPSALVPPRALRPDEQVLGRRTGTGPTDAALTGRTRDLVYVYGVCDGPGAVTARLLDGTVAEVTVPCDGVPSRLQVYTRPGKAFRLALDADPEQRWAVLVTARSLPSRAGRG